jgi:invasion protein IalB
MLHRPFPALAAAVVVLALGAGQRAAAAEAKFVSTEGDWSVFADAEKGAGYCYIGSQPQKEEGDYTRRGDTFVVVSHLPARKQVNVVRIRAGYTYKDDSEVEVNIGGRKFKLFTDDGRAWARDAKTDHALVAAMRAGLEMVVKGISSRGTLTTDTYSLKGFTAAHNAINRACGVDWP